MVGITQCISRQPCCSHDRVYYVELTVLEIRKFSLYVFHHLTQGGVHNRILSNHKYAHATYTYKGIQASYSSIPTSIRI